MLAAAPAHLQLMLLLCHDAALRAKAALSLTHREYDPVDRVLSIRGKHGKVQTVPASGRLAAMLMFVPSGDGPLVSLLAGRELGYAALRRQFVELCKRVGAPPGLRLHDLRRTMAVATYDTTHDLRVVQALLGHDSLRVTLNYLERDVHKLNPETIAAALDRTASRAEAYAASVLERFEPTGAAND